MDVSNINLVPTDNLSSIPMISSELSMITESLALNAEDPRPSQGNVINHYGAYEACAIDALTMMKGDLGLSRVHLAQNEDICGGESLVPYPPIHLTQCADGIEGVVGVDSNSNLQDRFNEVLLENESLKTRVKELEQMVENYRKIIDHLQGGTINDKHDALSEILPEIDTFSGNIKKEVRINCESSVEDMKMKDEMVCDEEPVEGFDCGDNDEDTTCGPIETIDTESDSTAEQSGVIHVCEICGQTFQSDNLLNDHMLSVHSDQDILWSTSCADQSTSPEIKSDDCIDQERLFHCVMCDKTYVTKRQLKLHMGKHAKHKSNVKEIHCKICDKIYADVSSLKRHVKRIHEGVKLVKFCEICGKGSENLKAHMLTHCEEKKHVCGVCNKSFANPYVLKKHVGIHSAEKSHLCTVCGKTFVTTEQLYGHKRFHSDNKRFECETCHHRFMLKTDLHNHLLTHTGEKPHQCSVCHRKFARSNQLKRHMITHSAERRLLNCSVCGRKFLEQERLDNHVQSHANDRERRHRCRVCGRAFTQAHHLRKHVNTMHGFGQFA